MSSVQQLLDAYPHCRRAVGYVELILCMSNDDDEETSWELLMRARPPMSPREVADLIASQAKDGITDPECLMPHMDLIYAQMQHPTFLTYIAGKMGAV